MAKNIIFGKNAVIEAIQSGKEIEKIYLQWSLNSTAYQKILVLAKKNKINVVQIDKNKFGKLLRENGLSYEKTQGVIALASIIDYIPLAEFIEKARSKEEKAVIVALDGINDPLNLGAIARVCECSGAFGLIVPERGTAPINASAMKSSAGALEYLPVTKVSSLIQAIDLLKRNGFWIVGTDVSAELDYRTDIYNSPVCVIIGSEGKGIGKGVLKHCDYVVKIPLRGKINSLNASVSAGIILYEIFRQRGF